jgi:hypothetical protein
MLQWIIALALLAAGWIAPLHNAAQSSAVRFAVIGDYGGGVGQPAVAEMVKGWQPDFIVTTGDNNYPNGAAETIDANIGQYYHEFIWPYVGTYGEGATANRFFPSLGNHDWDTDNAKPYLDYFVLPGNERYYDFVWGDVHIFVLNSDWREPDGIQATSAQAEWLRVGLANSVVPWQLVVVHAAPYSSGRHGSYAVMQWPYREWGADAVLAGHDHLYERLVVDDLVYFVNGAGGYGLYGFNWPVDGSQVRYNEDYGAMLVTATAASVTFEFYAVTDGGTLIDTHTIGG